MLQEALHNELNEARAAYARKSAASTQMVQHSSRAVIEQEEEEADLSPMLKVCSMPRTTCVA